MLAIPSLFDVDGAPVLATATDWIIGSLSGNLATGLCVIAIVLVGMMLMTGRVAIREGLRVALGCFVLLGAPTITAGLRSVADEAALSGPSRATSIEAPPLPAPLPSANYDPYAGASLRQD